MVFQKEHSIEKSKNMASIYKYMLQKTSSKNLINRCKSLLFSSLLVILITFINACGIYSFTGASIPPEVKSISIDFFPNQAELVNPLLSQEFTDNLRDRFLSQTSLNLLNGSADWEVKGAIIDYFERPVAASAQTAALNQLTIVVQVEFIDNFNEKNSWTKKFSRSQTYPGASILSDYEEELVTDINDQLINDIFNKIAVNW